MRNIIIIYYHQVYIYEYDIVVTISNRIIMMCGIMIINIDNIVLITL